MLKMFRDGARFATPLIIIFNLLTIVKGYKNPLLESVEALSKYENKVSILASFSYSQLHYSERYIVINTKTLDSLSVVIVKENGNVTISEHSGGLLKYIFEYIFLITLFWLSWFWPKKHNKSFKPTPESGAV